MDIYQNIKDGVYDCTMQRPRPPKKQCPTCNEKVTEITQFCPHCGAPLQSEHGKLQHIFLLEMNAYNDYVRQQQLKYKQDALEYCGLTHHPKADKAWGMAITSQCNVSDVVTFLEELSELML